MEILLFNGISYIIAFEVSIWRLIGIFWQTTGTLNAATLLLYLVIKAAIVESYEEWATKYVIVIRFLDGEPVLHASFVFAEIDSLKLHCIGEPGLLVICLKYSIYGPFEFS